MLCSTLRRPLMPWAHIDEYEYDYGWREVEYENFSNSRTRRQLLGLAKVLFTNIPAIVTMVKCGHAWYDAPCFISTHFDLTNIFIS